MAQQDALDAARDSGDAAELARLLQRQPGDAQELFERAIRLAGSEGGSSGGGGVTAASGTGLGNAGSSMENGSSSTLNGATAVVPAASAAAGTDGLQPAAAAWDAVHENREQQHAQPPAGGPGSASLATTGGAASGDSFGWQWYVYSYQAAWLARRAAFLASCADARITPGSESSGPAGYWEQAVATYTQALEVAGRGGAVLRRYRFAPATGEGQAQRSNCQTRASSACIMSCCYCTSMALSARLRALLTVSRTAPPSQVCSSRHATPATLFSVATATHLQQQLPSRPPVRHADDQLHKDVEGVLEEVVRDGLTALAKRSPGGQLEAPALLAPLLLLWDGVCWLFSGKAKPSGWVALLLKVGAWGGCMRRCCLGGTGRVGLSLPALVADTLV